MTNAWRGRPAKPARAGRAAGPLLIGYLIVLVVMQYAVITVRHGANAGLDLRGFAGLHRQGDDLTGVSWRYTPAATAPASVDDRLVWVGRLHCPKLRLEPPSMAANAHYAHRARAGALPGDVPVSIMVGYRHDAEVCYRDAGYTVEAGAPLTIDIDPVGDAVWVQVLSIQRGSEIADVFTWLIEPETGRSVGEPGWRDRLARIAVQWRRLLARSLVSDLLQVKVMIARPDVRVGGQPDRWRDWLRAVHRAARQCAAVPRS